MESLCGTWLFYQSVDAYSSAVGIPKGRIAWRHQFIGIHQLRWCVLVVFCSNTSQSDQMHNPWPLTSKSCTRISSPPSLFSIRSWSCWLAARSKPSRLPATPGQQGVSIGDNSGSVSNVQIRCFADQGIQIVVHLSRSLRVNSVCVIIIRNDVSLDVHY